MNERRSALARFLAARTVDRLREENAHLRVRVAMQSVIISEARALLGAIANNGSKHGKVAQKALIRIDALMRVTQEPPK